MHLSTQDSRPSNREMWRVSGCYSVFPFGLNWLLVVGGHRAGDLLRAPTTTFTTPFYLTKMKLSTLATLVFGLALVYQATVAEPPPGPPNKAKCPVTGVDITISSDTPFVQFKYGQKLFFSSTDAGTTYVKSPRDYWLAPHDLPLPGMDGKRGLPDLRNQTLVCPSSGENITVSMQTPRVVHKHGQNVYFCCFGCVAGFWTNPESMIIGL